MEKQTFVTREELEDLKREVDGLKSTIEILQDSDMMEQVEQSEEAKRKGVKSWKLKVSQ